MKTLICVLFHRHITYDGFAFTDSVSGQRVHYWKCPKCGRYMAVNKRDIFRVESKTTNLEFNN